MNLKMSQSSKLPSLLFYILRMRSFRQPAMLLCFITALGTLRLSAATETTDGREIKEPPLLLVLSFDGLRADFLNELLMPNLWKLARQGVWAPRGIKPQVLTVTAPNYYSISTGLYQENHGIIGNEFYDPDFKEFYNYWKLDEIELAKKARESKWYSGEPIWQTNENAGHYSGAMRWPLCDARVKNVAMSRCLWWEDYGDLPTWTNELDLLLSWYKDKKQPINLGFIYISEPDHTQHENDLYSPKVKGKLAELDALIWNLQRKLKNLDLHDRMNILFVSDHGHANVYAQHNRINLDEIIDPNDYVWSAKSIFPNPLLDKTAAAAKVQELYKKLEGARLRSPRFEVWRKEDVPERYHYKNNKRIGPIVLMERLGYQFVSRKTSFPRFPVFSSHGYSNDYFEMRAAFFAVGPAFKRNLTIDWDIENIDLYNLMAAVLQLKPARNDGNFSRVHRLLSSHPEKLETRSSAESMSTNDVKVQLVLQVLAMSVLVSLLR